MNDTYNALPTINRMDLLRQEIQSKKRPFLSQNRNSIDPAEEYLPSTLKQSMASNLVNLN